MKGSNTSNATCQQHDNREQCEILAFIKCNFDEHATQKALVDPRAHMIPKNCIWPLKSYQHASDVESKDVQGQGEHTKFKLQICFESPQGNMPQIVLSKIWQFTSTTSLICQNNSIKNIMMWLKPSKESESSIF